MVEEGGGVVEEVGVPRVVGTPASLARQCVSSKVPTKAM